jgi:hypothetical protein
LGKSASETLSALQQVYGVLYPSGIGWQAEQSFGRQVGVIDELRLQVAEMFIENAKLQESKKMLIDNYCTSA